MEISASRKYSVELFILSVMAFLWCSRPLCAQSGTTLEQRIKKIMERPQFAHSRFGLEFLDADSGEVLYSLNSGELFVPGSTTKLVTEGTMLELFGGEYRFHTKIYRTGPIRRDGTLHGDLVLVASGDPNLSNRIQPDGSLAFEDEDHSYGGPDSKGLSGDPLLVLREFAKQVAAKGIKRIAGRVLVDATLFPEGYREFGTQVILSPVVVNDNVVDVIVSPASAENAPVRLKIAPETSYVAITNRATTGKAGSETSLQYEDDQVNPDGTHTVTLSGTLAIDAKPSMQAYRVSKPSRFAATLLMEALKEQGVISTLATPMDAIDFKALAVRYTEDNIVAEHVSPPLKEEVKITLKVSQNLHASAGPFLLGAILAHKSKDIAQAGFDLEHDFLSKGGLDLSGAAQSDGAGGSAAFSPDFMVHYLRYMSHQKNYGDFHRALPILGKDGSLVKIQCDSPAAGHVYAKTGTSTDNDALNRKLMVTGKGLAGYMDTATGRHLIFAVYVNMVSFPPDAVGEALGEIAAAAYDQ
jgi:PBP4 family serine-type D-alanyl-D-alanine carboxypeptidase